MTTYRSCHNDGRLIERQMFGRATYRARGDFIYPYHRRGKNEEACKLQAHRKNEDQLDKMEVRIGSGKMSGTVRPTLYIAFTRVDVPICLAV
jgi:hypothetical protein